MNLTQTFPKYHYQQDGDVTQFFGKTLVRVDGDRNIAEQLENTPLDFRLELAPVFQKLPNDCGFVPDANHQFLVNNRTQERFDVVGKHWKPHQPTEVLTTFQDWCHDLSLNLTHVGQLDGGRVVYALADFPEVMRFGEDVTVTKILLSNFNKLGFSTKVDLFTYRLVCKNGLTVKSKENTIRLSHSNNGEIGDRLTTSLDSLHHSFQQHTETMEQLTRVTMNRQEAQMMLVRNFGNVDKPLDEQPQIVWSALQLFEGKAKGSEFLSAYNTAYGLLQSTTEYLNHHSRQTKTHLSSVLYGSKNNTAQKMMQSLSTTYLS